MATDRHDFGATFSRRVSDSREIKNSGCKSNVLIPGFLGDCKAAATSARGESAIDHKTVPRHKRRSVRAQPQNGLSHFLDATDATDGMQDGKVVLLRIQAIGEAIDHRGVDRGRIDRVDTNPLRGIFQRSGFRETDHGVFRRSIDPNSRESGYACD